MTPRLTLAAIATLIAVPAMAQEKVVHIYNWSDYIAEDTVKKFEEATGIKVVYDVYDSNETLEAKLLAGNSGYDVVVPTSQFMQRQAAAGVYQPLNKDALPNLVNMDPALMANATAYDPDNTYGVPYMWGTTGIGYNVKKIQEALGLPNQAFRIHIQNLTPMPLDLAIGIDGKDICTGREASWSRSSLRVAAKQSLLIDRPPHGKASALLFGKVNGDHALFETHPSGTKGLIQVAAWLSRDAPSLPGQTLRPTQYPPLNLLPAEAYRYARFADYRAALEAAQPAVNVLALVGHTAVAEAAVVGFPHDIKGQGIYAYVTLNAGVEPSDEVAAALKQQVRKEIGPIATPDHIHLTPGLPKTRSGKIMRRILRKIAENDFGSLGDTSTLADPGVVGELIDNRKEI